MGRIEWVGNAVFLSMLGTCCLLKRVWLQVGNNKNKKRVRVTAVAFHSEDRKGRLDSQVSRNLGSTLLLELLEMPLAVGVVCNRMVVDLRFSWRKSQLLQKSKLQIL